MKQSDLHSGVFFLLLSVFVSAESVRIGLGRWTGPGPGFLSFGAGVVLGLLSLLLILHTLYEKSKAPGQNWHQEVHWERWSVALGGILIYAFLLEYLGFILCTFFLMNGLILAVKPRRWKMALIVSIAATGGSYLFFEIWLKAQLPFGVFGI